MSTRYDIIYPKKGQLTLMCNEGIIANSKKKDYLKKRMKEHQDNCISSGILQENTYQIVDFFQNNLVLYTHRYRIGEKGNGKKRSPQGKKINFVVIDPIRPLPSQCYAIADDDGSIITNMELLELLYDFRFTKSIPCEVTNKSLAYLATYIPSSKEAFIKCYGMGKKTYEKCGEMFLTFINDFIKKNN